MIGYWIQLRVQLIMRINFLRWFDIRLSPPRPPGAHAHVPHNFFSLQCISICLTWAHIANATKSAINYVD